MVCTINKCTTKWCSWFSLNKLLFTLFTIVALIIWGAGFNQRLFYEINGLAKYLPGKIWLIISYITYLKHLILPIILLLITFFYKKDKTLKIITLFGLYLVVFFILKKIFAEPRPFIVLPPNSFTWLIGGEDVSGSEFMSFPSGHTGLVAIFIFALNRLFFMQNTFTHKFIRFISFVLLALVAIARVATGWHWPIDVIASGLIGYILVQIVFYNSQSSQD